MTEKKPYNKPEVKTQGISLGVYGEYGGKAEGCGSDLMPVPTPPSPRPM